jgi:hypothetical protein
MRTITAAAAALALAALVSAGRPAGRPVPSAMAALAFEPSGAGASDARVGGLDVSIHRADAVFSDGKRRTRMILEGADRRAELVASRRLSGTVNYLIGNEPRRWRTHIPTFGRVTARDVYPGIDLAYHGSQGRVEYDFVVAPGADPRAISLRLAGAGAPHLDARGDLVAGRAVRQLAPHVYQTVGGKRVAVRGRFVLRGRSVRFAVGPYDRSRVLVIDPTLVYSTYLGGSGDDAAQGMTVDNAGNAYISGCRVAACNDGFLIKLSPNGTPIWATYYGGSADDTPLAVAVDGSGQPIVAGWTQSTDWPLLHPYQAANAGGWDLFVTKFTADGTGLLYSTYLGGTADDTLREIRLDGAGNIHLAGETSSTNFPMVGAYQAANAGGLDALVATLSADGSSLLYSTYLGGQGNDEALGLALDSSGTYVAGYTASTDFPTANAYQGTFGGGFGDAFVTKLGPAGSTLVYSTYLGGSGGDVGRGITIDGAGNAFVGGYTGSTNFPTLHPYQPALAGTTDAFVTKVSPAGSALVYSTYLGGADAEIASAPALEANGSAWVTGYTRSTDFPLTSPIQSSYGGAQDAYVARLSPSGSALTFSTYLGGKGSDNGWLVRTAGTESAVVEGNTRSTDFPTANALQAASGGGLDGFVAGISAPAPPTAVLLRSFIARASRGGVVLRWRSVTLGVLGFDVYRGRQRLSRSQLPARSSSFRDPRGRRGDVYRIDVLEADGTRARVYTTAR